MNLNSDVIEKIKSNPINFTILGDTEPKPKPVFTNLKKMIQISETIDNNIGLDFIAGVGDIPHKGKESHYNKIRPTLSECTIPIYPIFLRGENPVVHGGSESDNSYTTHRRWQDGYSTAIRTIN